MELDPEIITTIRSNKTILQGLSNTGGLAGLLHLILRYVIGKIYRRMLAFEIYETLKK